MAELSYYHRNKGKHWKPEDDKQLKELAKENTPTPVIGVKMGRTVGAVFDRAEYLGISLMPPNPHHKKK